MCLFSCFDTLLEKHLLFLPVKYSWVSSNNSEHTELHFLCVWVEGSFSMDVKGVYVLFGIKFYKHVLAFIYTHGTDTKETRNQLPRSFHAKIKGKKTSKKNSFQDRRKCLSKLLLCASDYVDFSNSLLLSEQTSFIIKEECACVFMSLADSMSKKM